MKIQIKVKLDEWAEPFAVVKEMEQHPDFSLRTEIENMTVVLIELLKGHGIELRDPQGGK